MKRIAVSAAVVAATLFVAPAAMADNEDAPGKNKVTICHVTPGQSVTLTIPEDQANGHLTGKAAGHDINGPVEDYLGECRVEPTPTPEPTPTVEPTPEPTVDPTPEATPTAVPVVEVEPVVEPTPTVEPTPDVVAVPEGGTAAPDKVNVPNEATTPSNIPAGEGSGGTPAALIAMLAIAAVTASAAGLRLVK